VQRHPAEPYEAVPGKEVILGFIVKTETPTDRLVKLLHALESVQASSVESERAFSCAGSFVTKVRNKMGDNTLDNYCLLDISFRWPKSWYWQYNQNQISRFFCFFVKKMKDPDSGSLNFLSLPLGSVIIFTVLDSGSLHFLSLPLRSVIIFTGQHDL
jgi:hypothetical protein